MKTIKVLVVDDSTLIRNILKEIISNESDMVVVGTAPDAPVAREMIQSLKPDVLTLDVEMPKMNGLDFLEELMLTYPMPVLMISSFTEWGSEPTLRALELGAIDFVSKPKLISDTSMMEYAEEITSKIRMASKALLYHVEKKMKFEVSSAATNIPKSVSVENIVVFGASTGGTEALKEVLMDLPRDCPGIVITQHMPEGFTRLFSQRLDGLCKIKVKEAEHGERILPGHAYIAPGHSHLLIARSDSCFVCELSQSAPVNRHRPSVEVLFKSAAKAAGKQAIGVILTGMGKDGAIGMKEMHEAGAHTFAQDEASCVVFGMPKEAISLGGVDEIVPLKDLSSRILVHLKSIGSN